MQRANAPHDDPASCVDQPYWQGELPSGLREPLMSAVAGLGECAALVSQPANVRAYVTFQPGGTVAKVSITRASTDNCAALDCVRRHLAEVKATLIPRPPSFATGVDFTLEAHPKLDTTKLLQWEPGSDKYQCTDAYSTPDFGDRRAADAAVLGHQDKLYACYQDGLKRDPSLKGLVVIRGVVEPQGKFVELVVRENQLADCQVVSCLRTEVQSIVFPVRDKRYWVNLAFSFRPDAPKPKQQPLW